MDPSSQFIVPTIIDVPELIVTNEDIDFEDSGVGLNGSVWLNKLQLLSSTLSCVVGLGNIWRFPHLCYKYGGGAFLSAYTFILITVGLPLFLMELGFGQYANEGPITIWRISPAFEGIGYAMCLISAMIAIYYNIINTWIIHYLLASLTFSDLPWSRCDNSWNTAQCFLRPDEPTISSAGCNTTNQTNPSSTNDLLSSKVTTTTLSHFIDADGKLTTTTTTTNNGSILYATRNCSNKVNSYEFESIINSNDNVTLPADEYFHNNVLAMSGSLADLGGLNWNLLTGLIVVWGLVFVIILKDIRFSLTSITASANPSSANKWPIVALLMPYLALTALFVRAITLPGSADGISHYFTPDWSRLQNMDIWTDAVTQIFFSLSPCWGGIITLASMNKFHNNFHSDAMLIVAINYATCFFSGLVAFAILGHMSSYSGIAINEVVESGLGFIFMVYTEALAKLPLASLNSLLFFATLLFLGLSSQLTVIETVITTIVDTWPHKLRYRKPLILMILCTVMFVLSLSMCFGNGFYILQLFDAFAGTYTAMIIGILELIAIAWVYGMENFMQDIDDMISVHRNLFPSRSFWYFMWRYLTPSILFAVVLFSFIDQPSITYHDQILPSWSLKFGWIFTFCCLLVIPAVAFVRFLLSPSGSFLDKINYLCRPSEDWAPSSYVSGPKLLNRHHMLNNRDYDVGGPRGTIYSSSSQRGAVHGSYDDQDQESQESMNEDDLKVVDGRANYIIPEEEDDTDTGLVTNETNL